MSVFYGIIINNMSRVAVFIDNSNVFKNLCSLQKTNANAWCKQYDPLFLAKKLCGNRELVKVNFYCAMPPAELLKRDPVKYAKQSSYYDAVRKQDKVEVRLATLTINNGKPSEKNLDTQLTKDAIVGAALNKFDQAIIISNDGDFVSVVEGVKEVGKKVEVAHFKGSFSMDLKQKADITRRLRPSYFRFIGETQLPLIDNQKTSTS